MIRIGFASQKRLGFAEDFSLTGFALLSRF